MAKILYIFLIITVVIVVLIVLFKPRLSNDPMNINYYISNSKIHSQGLFSKITSKNGEILFKAIAQNKRITPTGAKVNHCWTPNTLLRQYNDGWWLIASKDIQVNDEITADYRYTPDFIAKPNSNWKC